MGTISLSLPADGTTGDVADVNTPFTTIANEINGNLDNANIKAGAAIDGSKLADASITGTKLTNSHRIQRQNNTTNVEETTARILTGWGVITGAGTSVVSETVTFNSAFTSAPVVIITYGGDTAAATTALGSGGLNVRTSVIAIATSITTTTFLARIQTVDASTWSAPNSVYYQWMAIGI